jgi:hypothetical protein
MGMKTISLFIVLVFLAYFGMQAFKAASSHQANRNAALAEVVDAS